MATPVSDYLPDDRDTYEGVCMRCGWPLTKYQIAADFSGTCVNYIDHSCVPFSACVCADCMVAITECVNGGPIEAYRKIYVASVLTRQAYDEVEEHFSNTTEE
jgi:hypothetical protein